MWKKIVLGILGAIAVVVGGGLAYLTVKKPAMQAPSTRTVEKTPERVARGKYLFEHVANCADCHSDVHWDKFATPIKEGGLAVGRAWPTDLGLPGTFYSPNLTSDAETGVGAWSDGELIRAIREGISRDGRVLFPLMPYTEFRNMSDVDAESIVAYIRTIPAVNRKQPITQINFPVNLMIKGAPQPVTAPVPSPDRNDKIAYGKYLTIIGGCHSCHTPSEHGSPKPGTEYTGGEKFGLEGRGLLAVSFNLTPDNNTGIGTWDENQFLEKFHQYKEYAEGKAPPSTPENFTVMPWLAFNGLEDDDLRSIFAFLKSLKPVEHVVETRPLAAKK
ncbi:MAG: cytochrome c [Acidobacteriota bacterium]